MPFLRRRGLQGRGGTQGAEAAVTVQGGWRCRAGSNLPLVEDATRFAAPLSDFIYRRSISDRTMPIGKAKHRFWDRAPPSAQRAEGDRDRRTALRRLRSRSGGLWGFLRGCKGGDSEPLPRPLKGLFPFVKGNSCTRSIANSSVPSPQPFYPESPTCEASLTFFTGEAFLTGLCQ